MFLLPNVSLLSSSVSGKMKDIFRDHIMRLCQVESWNPSVEKTMMVDKLLLCVEQICELVDAQFQPVTQENKTQLQASQSFDDTFFKSPLV